MVTTTRENELYLCRMSHTTIARDTIKQFSSFSQAFGNQSTFGQFLTAPFQSVADIYEQAKRKQAVYSPETRRNLVQVWNRQIADFASESQLNNLKLLENEQTLFN